MSTWARVTADYAGDGEEQIKGSVGDRFQVLEDYGDGWCEVLAGCVCGQAAPTLTRARHAGSADTQGIFPTGEPPPALSHVCARAHIAWRQSLS